MNARNAAYHALLAYLRDESPIMDTLELWQKQSMPAGRDFALAYEIASGSTRMALHLDEVAKQLSSNGKLSIKLKEKALLRTAIYQYCFMSKIPVYAMINETIEIAKVYCHPSFVKYVNALLRKLVLLPKDQFKDKMDLGIYYSYPKYFVDRVVNDYGEKTAVDILEAGNQAPVVMARIRQSGDVKMPQFEICDRDSLNQMAASPKYYIQNSTPALLAYHLYQAMEKYLPEGPKNILDLCASPGGKLLIAHEFYPKAELFANDVSKQKISRLRENLDKYGIDAVISCGPGEEYPLEKKFGLIILDVPCSNSGVLNKRPEARWRLKPENLRQLNSIQTDLLEHAAKLLQPEGAIWFMTCSLLKDENERFIEKIAKKLTLHIVYTKTILPGGTGADGGFAALLFRDE